MFSDQVQFGTLSDYFGALRKSIAPSNDATFFPSLAGDFFTYSDRLALLCKTVKYLPNMHISCPKFFSVDCYVH